MTCHSYSKECDFIKENGIKPCCVSHLLEIFEKLSKILRDNNIFFYITYGTLLGHERHNGIIPWDDDLDIMCLGKDKMKILYLCQLLLPDYDVKRVTGGKTKQKYPEYDYCSIYYSKSNRNHVDIGFLEQIDDNYFIDSTVNQAKYIKEKGRIYDYKGWIVPIKYLLPLKEIEFYNIKCYKPNKSIELLKFWYNEDVMYQTYIKDRHIAGNIGDLVKSDKNIFIPAIPLKNPKVIIKPTSNHIYKVLIINIEKRKDRLYQTIEQCNKINVYSEQQKAVEGHTLNKENLISSGVIKNKNMHINEYGCYLSHVNCLLKISNDTNKNNLYIIVEDDIEFIDSFNRIINDNIKYIRENEGIYLLGGILYNKNQYNQIHKNIYDVGLSTGTWAYLLNSTIAKKILDNILPIILPYDLVVTVPNDLDKYPTNKQYSDVLYKKIKKYCIFDNNNKIFDNNRFGIVKELSTGRNESSSSTDYIHTSKNVNISKNDNVNISKNDSNLKFKLGITIAIVIIISVVIAIVINTKKFK